MEQRIPTYPRLFRKFFKRLSGLDKCTKLANLCMRRLIYPIMRFTQNCWSCTALKTRTRQLPKSALLKKK